MFARHWILSAIAALALIFPVLAFACHEPVAVSNTSIPLTPGSTAVAYPSITSAIDDTLLGASSPCCKTVELHTHDMTNGVMRMRKVDAVPLKAKVPTLFQSGGLHLMLIGLKQPLKAGDVVPITLRFGHVGEQAVPFTVGAAGLQAPADSHTHQH
jgi:copper(I)-binding protein